MSNQLTSLSEFSRYLFKHAFLLLPWFAGNFQDRTFAVQDVDSILPFLRKIKKEKPHFFGIREEICDANKSLSSFFDKFRPDGDSKVNQEAVDHYMDVWKSTWKNRKSFQLRGHEVKLMKYFHEIFSGSDHVHLPELLSMARLIDRETVNVARKVSIPDGWEAEKAFAEESEALNSQKKKLFGSRDVTVDAWKEIQSKHPDE